MAPTIPQTNNARPLANPAWEEPTNVEGSSATGTFPFLLSQSVSLWPVGRAQETPEPHVSLWRWALRSMGPE